MSEIESEESGEIEETSISIFGMEIGTFGEDEGELSYRGVHGIDIEW